MKAKKKLHNMMRVYMNQVWEEGRSERDIMELGAFEDGHMCGYAQGYNKCVQDICERL